MIDTLFRFAGLLGLLAALSNPAHSGSANPPWLLSGHASVGLLYNDSDAQYYRELSQRGAQFGHWAYENDTRFGLRLAYRPNQEISGELQLLTKYGPSGDFQTNLVSALTRVRLAGGWMLRTGIIPL